MSNLTFPCLDPSSPAPPPSPMQPICTSLFSTRSSRADERRIPEFPGNPYSQGVAAWRIWLEKIEGVTTVMKKTESGGWTEKYRPRAMDEFICHREIALRLRQQVAQGVDSHFIFEGPPGVGKKTMVRAFLREAFGPDTLETREELKEFELKGEDQPNIERHVTLSPQHIEIDLSKIKGNEKHVITALVEETHTMAAKAIVLYQADQLCMDTQDYIRWIMVKHKNCHKFLFCCSDLSNLQSIRSICTMIQLLPPSNDEIFSVLEHIAEKEGIEITQDVALTIAKDSTYNLPQAIRLFESSSLAKL